MTVTKDQIANLLNEYKTDKLVAINVLGMQLESNLGLAGGHFWVGNGVRFGEMRQCDLWRFSDDFSCAWDVLEFLSQKYECSTAVGREYPFNRGVYVARMVGGRYQYNNPELKLYALAETAPLANCRLALLTVAK